MSIAGTGATRTTTGQPMTPIASGAPSASQPAAAAAGGAAATGPGEGFGALVAGLVDAPAGSGASDSGQPGKRRKDEETQAAALAAAFVQPPAAAIPGVGSAEATSAVQMQGEGGPAALQAAVAAGKAGEAADAAKETDPTAGQPSAPGKAAGSEAGDQTPAQQSPGTKAAEALAATQGVTAIKGASETTKLDAPAALTPPTVKGAKSAGAADKGDGKAGAKPEDAPQTAAAGEAKPAAAPDAETARHGPEDQTSKSTGARADGPTAGSPTPDRPGAQAGAMQTSAAPQTPAANQPQAAGGANVAAAVQVATQIASGAGSRRTRFEVRLDPGELGRVDVRLDIAHDGRLATRLIVERPETLELLRNDARELARTLEQAGFQLGQGGLAFQLRDGRQGDWATPAQPSSTSASATDDEIEVEASASALYRRASATGRGGVDMTV